MPHVSIVLVNYNTARLTIDCIKSIQSKTLSPLNYEIIVVDNGSKYDDYEELLSSPLLKNDSNIYLLREKQNLGFGGGNQRGALRAKGKYIAFINTDVLLENDCLGILYNFLENNEAVVGGATQLSQSGEAKKSFDHHLSIKREILGRNLLQKLNPNSYPDRKKRYSKPLQVDCVPGSFMMVDRDAFNIISGFDCNLFLYYEETDLCRRLILHNKNWSTFHVPEARYIHLKGASTDSNIAITREMKISYHYVLRKFSSTLSYLLFYNFQVIKTLIKSIGSSKSRKLLPFLLKGFPLHHSFKLKQVIHDK